MYSPKLPTGEQKRDIVDTFGGYNNNVRIGENEFHDMKNMSSRYFPVISPRAKRGVWKKNMGIVKAMTSKGEIAYIENNVLWYRGEDFPLHKYEQKMNQERQLVSMGSKLLVFPDNVYINTAEENIENIKLEEMYRPNKSYSGTYTLQLADANDVDIKDEDLIYGIDDKTFVAKSQTIYIDPSKSQMAQVIDLCLPSSRYTFQVQPLISNNHDDYLGDYVDCVLDDQNKLVITLKTVGAGEPTLMDRINEFYSRYGYNSGAEVCYAIVTVQENKAVGGRTRYYKIGSRQIKENENKRFEIKTNLISPNDLCMRTTSKDSKDSEGSEDSKVYIIQQCTRVAEGATSLDTWKSASSWQGFDSYVRITSNTSDLKTAITDILTDRSSEYLRVVRNTTDTVIKPLLEKYGANTYNMVQSSVRLSNADNTVLIKGTLNGTLYHIVDNLEVKYESIAKPLDFVIESNNRLWGCRYGTNVAGEFVNEIYATKQGTFFWDALEGTAADSYAVSVGSDGPFTGAVNYKGTPIFFKENTAHMVYGSYPENYNVTDESNMGLQKGSHKSISVMGNSLYYKAADGIYRYDGASLDKISSALGEVSYSDAVGCCLGNSYYVAMRSGGEKTLFVYDIGRGIWYKEDSIDAEYMATLNNDLYIYDNKSGQIYTVKGSVGTPEDAFEWYVESGDFGYSTPDMKYISKIQIRLVVPVESSVNIFIEYDSSGYKEFIGGISGTSLMSFTLPLFPRRCDHFKIRIEGKGECKIYSISKVLEDGGES